MGEINILEGIVKGGFDKDSILRRLLILYGDTERYFYHYSYRSLHGNGNIITNELIECTKETYDKIKLRNSTKYHKPIKYMSNKIPVEKKVRSILYTR